MMSQAYICTTGDKLQVILFTLVNEKRYILSFIKLNVSFVFFP